MQSRGRGRPARELDQAWAESELSHSVLPPYPACPFALPASRLRVNASLQCALHSAGPLPRHRPGIGSVVVVDRRPLPRPFSSPPQEGSPVSFEHKRFPLGPPGRASSASAQKFWAKIGAVGFDCWDRGTRNLLAQPDFVRFAAAPLNPALSLTAMSFFSTKVCGCAHCSDADVVACPGSATSAGRLPFELT